MRPLLIAVIVLLIFQLLMQSAVAKSKCNLAQVLKVLTETEYLKQLPSILIDEITNIQEFKPLVQGGRSEKVYTGTYRGRKVFLKEVWDESMAVEEGRAYVAAEPMQFTPHFHGIAYDKSLKYKLPMVVVDYIDGAFFKIYPHHLDAHGSPRYKLIRNGVNITEEVCDQIDQIGVELTEAGFYSDDLQFMISTDGKVHLIDLGDFRHISRARKNGPSVIDQTHKASNILRGEIDQTTEH